jgi:hypothetical protein
MKFSQALEFHKLKIFCMTNALLVVFIVECCIFLILSAPLHSILIRPKVQAFVKQLIDFKLIYVCGLGVNVLLLSSIYAGLQLFITRRQYSEPLPWAVVGMHWCICAYYKLRCKYENMRDLKQSGEKEE